MINAKERLGQQGFVRILIGESDDVDAFVLQCEVSKLDIAYSLKRIGRKEEFEPSLRDFSPDLVIINYSFGGLESVATAKEKAPNAPIILMVTTAPENFHATALKHGIADYVLKSQLSKLLAAIERALRSRNGSSPSTTSINSAAKSPAVSTSPLTASPLKSGASVVLPEPQPYTSSATPIDQSVGARLARLKERLKVAEPSTPIFAPAMQSAEKPGDPSAAQPKEKIAERIGTQVAEMSATKTPTFFNSEMEDFAAEMAELRESVRVAQDNENEIPEIEDVKREREKIGREIEQRINRPVTDVTNSVCVEPLDRGANFESLVGDRMPEDAKENLPVKSPVRGSRKASRRSAGEGANELAPAPHSENGTSRKASSKNRPTMAAEFRALFDWSLDAVMIFDDEGTCRQANPAASILLGLTQSEVVGRKLAEFTEPVPGPLLEHAWQAFVSRGDQKGDKRLVLPNGTIREIEYCARIHFSPGNHLLIARDVTARKRQDEEFKNLQAQLEKSNAERAVHLQTCAQLEAKVEELSRAEEAARRWREETASAIATKNAQVKEALEQARTETIKRKQAEDDAKLFHEQLEQNVAKRTDELEASNNEIRLLARYLQLSREEERRRLTHYVQDDLGEYLAQLKIDLGWLQQRLAKTEEGLPRRQLTESVASIAQLVANSGDSLQRIKNELGRWAKVARKG